MKTKTIYITDDNIEFTDKKDAIKHQEELDSLDYKTEYYKLKQEILLLKTKIEWLEKLQPYPQQYKDLIKKDTETPYSKLKENFAGVWEYGATTIN